jgi:hypothetical protein
MHHMIYPYSPGTAGPQLSRFAGIVEHLPPLTLGLFFFLSTMDLHMLFM